MPSRPISDHRAATVARGVGDRDGGEAEHGVRREGDDVAHDAVDDHPGGLEQPRHRLDDLRLTSGDGRVGDRDQQREDDDRDHLAVGEVTDDVLREEVDHHVRHRPHDAAERLGVDVAAPAELGAPSDAEAEGDAEGEDDRDPGGEDQPADRPQAHPAQGPCGAEARHAGEDRDDDERADEGDESVDVDGADRLDVLDLLLEADADTDAERDRQQRPGGEADAATDQMQAEDEQGDDRKGRQVDPVHGRVLSSGGLGALPGTMPS